MLSEGTRASPRKNWKNKCVHFHGVPLSAPKLTSGLEATGYFVHF